MYATVAVAVTVTFASVAAAACLCFGNYQVTCCCSLLVRRRSTLLARFCTSVWRHWVPRSRSSLFCRFILHCRARCRRGYLNRLLRDLARFAALS